MSRKTWLITGASSGLGKALAEHVLAHGDQVVATASSTKATTELAARYPETAMAVKLDVTDPADRVAAVRATEERFGGIDILVNNAAIDFIGALEEQEESDYRRLFEVNFFGAVALTRAVLPVMRAQRSGVIVNVSSMDGLASLPANGYYSASKFALEGFTEALWQEIEPLGLHAMIVQPGSFRTGIENRTRASGEAIEDYSATAGAFRAMMTQLTPEMFPGDPERAAEAIHDAVAGQKLPHWVVLGSDAQRRIGVKLDQLRTEFEAGEKVALSTDFPGAAANAVL
ncbi:oxidoreductase [Streptomyces cocklensis]|jgi:NAD(P)-dependent dehydrogenase (short-subunit alcohol dehydrogenase family)|uniref:Short chain dehydrogenase n=1 Tax=Actinacidiphila cocklensis TaxID=887465 RepID=A0A9W4E179_9ACTN|nr:oxidoreductase [Actinacidiphila cocklensis]MDD1058536.1 oxidoreductase [Actinacidiphila cocklensis]WSX75255.1 oxidoreductase [Streptomyces sp. NBC_00899]CAG6390705.1 Short chain dehydrogenase [Actinacidiphila cocklensis]